VNKQHDITASEDRRRFFRIDDAINLYYKIVDEQTVISASKMTDDVLSSCSLATALDVLGQESRLILHRVEKREPEIAEYLKLMDSKIGLLAQAVLQQDNDLSESKVCNTNLSASGLAIEVETPVKEGEFIEVKLFLSSCVAVILLYGKVVYCKKNAESSYQIGIDYINLKDEDREVLIKHIVKRQMQQIRENKVT
jgi:c-di-GMP-binding flagellar brake protein YcgR